MPFPILLAGSGIILILSGMLVNKITGNSEISGIGLVLVVLGLVPIKIKKLKFLKSTRDNYLND